MTHVDYPQQTQIARSLKLLTAHHTGVYLHPTLPLHEMLTHMRQPIRELSVGQLANHKRTTGTID